MRLKVTTTFTTYVEVGEEHKDISFEEHRSEIYGILDEVYSEDDDALTDKLEAAVGKAAWIGTTETIGIEHTVELV